jgi:hypothetical protein
MDLCPLLHFKVGNEMAPCNGAGAVCDQKTSNFLYPTGKNPWQDTQV